MQMIHSRKLIQLNHYVVVCGILQCVNNREYDACNTLLSIPLHDTNPHTTIRWLDVNEIRSRKIKTRKEIESLNIDSTDIFFTIQ